MRKRILPLTALRIGLAATVLAFMPVIAAAETPAAPPTPAMVDQPGQKIALYSARFGRSRPVIAIIGENSGTELTDFVIPYGVLAQSETAELVAVATQPGRLNMTTGPGSTSLQIEPQATIEQFDARFPDGADYVIVPAVNKFKDTTLLAWLVKQGSKGGTVVSICDGALALASSGLTKDHQATGHWYTHDIRTQKFPDTHWVKNVRYVADGKIVSSAGISAAMPTSLALVEAIAGHDKALAVAQKLGVADWSTLHNSDVFRPRFGVNLMAFAATQYTNGWFHANQDIGVPVASGIDEIALAFTVDAYSRTGRSHAYALSASSAPVQTRYGLTIVPERVIGGPNPPNQVLTEFDATPSALVLDKVLAEIAHSYGSATAYGVALEFEYPGFQK